MSVFFNIFISIKYAILSVVKIYTKLYNDFMRKAIVVLLLSISEIYGMTILGYLYSISKSDIILAFIIIGICVCVLSSLLFIYILMEKKPKKRDKHLECPYFIEKYDDMVNPEYIDRRIK